MDKERALRDAFRRLLVVQGVFDRATRPCGMPLNLPHAHALLELHHSKEPMTVTELSKNLRIDRTNVSRLCQRMVDEGELERVQDQRDKRARVLQLTEKGKKLADHVDQSSTRHFGKVVEALGENAEGVLGALGQLEQALRKASREQNEEKRNETE